MLSQIGQVIVQLSDNLMVARLGALPLAAVSFGGAVFTIFLFWGTGLSLGLTPLTGEAYAQRKIRTTAGLLQNALVLYSLVGLLLFGVLWMLGDLLEYMGQSPEVVRLAVPYYRYLAWSIIPYMVYLSFKQFLEGVGNTRTGMAVVLIANAINIVFNYLLIFGKGGFPELGAAGAGLSTLISRICMPLFMLAYFLWNQSVRRYFAFFSRTVQTWRNIRRLLSVGLPISVQVVLEVMAFALSSIMMGWIGPSELAAHQIVLSVGTMAYMMQVGISTATTILVSHAYGRKDRQGIRLAAAGSCHLGLAFAVVTMSCLILFRYRIPMLFTDDAAVVAIAGQLFIFAGLYQLSDSLQIILVGVLRGMQDVAVLMSYSFVSYLLINLPVGYLCAFTLGIGPSGLWIGFIFGLSIAAWLYYRRYRKLSRRNRPDTAATVRLRLPFKRNLVTRPFDGGFRRCEYAAGLFYEQALILIPGRKVSDEQPGARRLSPRPAQLAPSSNARSVGPTLYPRRRKSLRDTADRPPRPARPHAPKAAYRSGRRNCAPGKANR